MILFENSHVLAVDKRAGYLSVVSRLGEKDPRPCEFLEWRKEKGEKLWSVHRLDEEVSGVLVLAKTPEAHSVLNQAFEGRELGKTYEAWTENTEGTTPSKEKQHWESLLLRGKKRAYEKPFGKRSITEALYLGNIQNKESKLLKWNLFPLTGRAHQLRYELFKHGYPIWGDYLYGGKSKFPLENAIALRAVSLDLSQMKERNKLELPLKIEAMGLHEWLEAVNSN